MSTSPGPRPRITALVPSGNEEANIRDCLDSLRWADEILVVDSNSTDGTRAIAAEFTDRILVHEYVNSAAQKNWALPQCSHPWVLIVDCDERVTPALRDEILELLATGPTCAGYRIFRLNHFLGRRIRYCGWQNDSCVRLFQRDRGRYADRQVHADVVLDGPCGRLRQRLLHYTFRSFGQYMEKFDRYTTWAAGDRGRRTGRVDARHLLLRPAFRFFKQYVLKRGFLDGRAGLVVCGMAAFSVFLKYAKLWEMQECAPQRPAR